LERFANAYSQLVEGNRDRPLIQDQRPPFDFETIYELDYAIDPTRPIGNRGALPRMYLFKQCSGRHLKHKHIWKTSRIFSQNSLALMTWVFCGYV
jgi:hypothetical protein